jgi:hypothetical protein
VIPRQLEGRLARTAVPDGVHMHEQLPSFDESVPPPRHNGECHASTKRTMRSWPGARVKSTVADAPP